jgi:hypothetical protein
MEKQRRAEKVGLDKSSREYEKPLFEESEGMTFTDEIWNKLSAGRFGCMQCSSCHGCA